MKTWKTGSSATALFSNILALRAMCAAMAFSAPIFLASPLHGQCTVPTAPAPTLPADTVWVEDAAPPDASVGDTWIWDSDQKVSGSLSHMQPPADGLHQHYFEVPPSSFLWVSSTDTLVTYAFLDPCNPPTELLLQFNVAGDGWEHRAYWGANLCDWGTDGTDSRRYMGPLPPVGQWVRLEISVSAIGIERGYLAGMAFTLWDGRAWFDRSGKAGVCALGTAPAPSVLPIDTVWFDDALPPGSGADGPWTWDTAQKMSGSASHTQDGAREVYQRLFYATEQPLPLDSGDTLVQYVLLDPCEAPGEIMLQFAVDGSWEHRAYWGENLIGWGADETEARRYIGALPPAGVWGRLEIPIAALGLSEGQQVDAMAFTLSNGRAWFDRTGKNASPLPSLTGLSIAPNPAGGGSPATGTVALSGAAPSTGARVSLEASDPEVAMTPSFVVVPAGQTSATFPVSTSAVTADASTTITAVYLGASQMATLAVTAQATPVLSSLTLSPSQVAGGSSSTGTVELAAAAPVGGVLLELTSSDLLVATVPGTVLVPSGQTSVTFTIVASGVVADSAALISAKGFGTVKAAWLSVATSSVVSIVSVSVDPASVLGGSAATGTVTLSHVAPPGGVPVGLSSNNALASVPASVTVAEGAATATFPVSTLATESTAVVTISGTYSGTTRSASLTVTSSPAPALASLTLNPTTVMGSSSSTGTVTLTLPARTGGALVSLHSDAAFVGVPADVAIAAGSTSATFSLSTTNVEGSSTATISASYVGVTQTAVLTVSPCVAAQAPAPSSFPQTDVVWLDEDLPPGSAALGAWQSDTSQMAAGVKSFTTGLSSAFHEGLAFTGPDAGIHLRVGDKIVLYALVDPCNPPSELLLRFADETGSYEHAVYWGQNVISQGTQPLAMGAMPSLGQWTRLEIPAAAIELEGKTLSGVWLFLPEGRVWLDHIGRSPTCTTAVATAPSTFPSSDFVWIDDSIPGSGGSGTPWTWDATQKASGTASLTMGPHIGAYDNYAWVGNPQGMPLSAGDRIIVYVLLDPCDPPQELLLDFADGNAQWGHVAYWGANEIDHGTTRLRLGDMPAAGQWTRLEIPVDPIGMQGHSAIGIWMFMKGGQFWFDRIGGSSSAAPAALTSLSVSPSSMTGGLSATGSVSLDRGAPSGGASVSLSSDNGAATVPASVNIPEGVTAVTFSVTTSVVGAQTVATLSANYAGVTKTAPLTVNSPASASLVSVSLSPTSVAGGTSSTGTVTLDGPAPAGGAVVSLSSDNAAASVPSSVTLAQGATTSTFVVTTGVVSNTQSAVITATYAGVSRTASLQITAAGCSFGTATSPASFPPDLVWFDDAPPAIANLGGTWTWDTAQKASGTRSHTEPIAAGTTQHYLETSGTSNLQLSVGDRLVVYVLLDPCHSPREVMIQWRTAGSWEHRAFWGEDLVGWGASGTQSRLGQGALPAAGEWTRLEVSAASLGLDGQTVEGVAFVLFDGKAWFDHVGKVNQDHTPILASLGLDPSEVSGGASSTGSVTLTGAAPEGGSQVSLSSSSSSVASVPSSVTVPAGTTSATFTIATSPVAEPTDVTLTATSGPETRTATLTVEPPGVASLVVLPASVVGGGVPVATVTLTNPSPAGGAEVSLWSANPAVAGVPASVIVAAGTMSATFALSTSAVGSAQNVSITATYGISSRSTTVSVNPPDLSTLSLNPQSVTGGSPSTGTATLTGPAPAGGWTVTLSSSIGSATVPPSVTVPQGSTSATFTVTTTTVAGVVTATITATHGTTVRTADLALSPPGVALSAISLSPAWVVAGASATGTVTLTNAAPAGGRSVDLSSSDAAATVPASVTVAQGATTATFAVATSSSSSPRVVTITAVSAGVTLSAALTVAPPLPSGELTEGTASDWSAFAADSAATALTNDTAHTRAGANSLKLTTSSAADTGVRYPAVGELHWDLSGRTFLTFWLYVESSGSFAGNQPSVVLLGPSGSIRYTPSSPLTFANKWHHYEIALTGDSGWARAVTGTVDLTNISAFEIHHQAAPAGFTAWYDDVSFVSALPIDFAEGNAALWGTTDLYVQRIGDDTSHVRAGSSSIDFKTGSGYDAAILFPAAGNAHWDVSSADSLTFWLYTINTNQYGFEGPQPVVVLKSASGSYTYTPPDAPLSIDAWRLYQIPLAGGGMWTRTSTGVPSLSDVNQVEFHFDTWGYGFELFLDGVTFGHVLADLTLSPASVVGGSPATATVTLVDPAPAGGLTLNLASDDSTASVPATVSVPAGSLSTTFPVTTTTVSVAKNPNISWSAGTMSHRAVLNITPSPALLTYAIDPEAVVAGTGATGTVRLNGVAPAGGVVVTLTSAYPSAIGVPPTVTVSAGLDSATFAVETYPYYDADVWLNTTASAGGVTKSFRLFVAKSSASSLASLSLSPTILLPSESATGTVTLNHVAPAGGAVVGLTSSVPGVATVPSSVTVSAGESTATFSIMASATPSATTTTITASLNGVNRTAVLRVTYLSSVDFSVNPAVGGTSATGTVHLSGAAPASGLVVSLTSSDPGLASVPATVSVPSGAAAASFTVTTAGVPSHTAVTITAQNAGISATVVLSLEATGFDAFTISSPSTVKAGTRSTLGIDLKDPAPAGGNVVSLSSSGAVWYYVWEDSPAYHHYFLERSWTLTIPAGQTSLGIEWAVPWSPSAVTGSLTVTINGLTKTISVQGTPGTAVLSLESLPTVSRGGTVRGYITFDGYAAASSMNVSLSSSNPAIVLSPNPVVAGGWSLVLPLVGAYWMDIGVTNTSGTGLTTITSTSPGIGGSAVLTVNPSVLTTLTASPSTFRGGTPVQITAHLDFPAPPEGALISLTSSSPTLLPLPATVLVPAGQQAVTFTATPQVTSTSMAVTLSATYGPNTRTLPLKVWADSSASVSGVVLDARIYDHDQPLPGVAVSLTTDPSNATTTDSTGVYHLFADPGASSVSLTASGFATTTLPGFTAVPYGTIDEGSVRLKYVLSGPVLVSGNVVTGAGSAVAGAAGSLEGYEGAFTTDGSGHYSFNGPNLNPFRLTFSKTGFPTRTSDTFTFVSTGVSSSLDAFILDTAPLPVLAAIEAGPNPIAGGTTAALILTLSAPAPSNGAEVTLHFSNELATPTYSLATISAGLTTQSFAINTFTVSAPQTTAITAFYGGVQLATTLTVIPATGVLNSVSVNPTTVVGGSTSTGTVTLSGPAPTGGAGVALSSNDSAATVPASVSVPQGATTATFNIATTGVSATRSATITAVYGYTRTATLALTPAAAATLAGIAPGWVLPGDTTPVLYGANILAGSTVTFTGPVYTLTNTATMLCTPGTNCPSSALAATIDVGGTYAAFAIPPVASPGIYQLRVRSSAGVDSSNNELIAVEAAQKTQAALSGAGHNYASRIYPGQTITGTLNGDVPLNGISDYNYYYFVATAGTRLNLTMQRADSSIPWENPASLDPQLEVIAPDGFIYTNLQAFDDVPGNDLNASLTGAILPQTGVYIIAAETTRGSGPYSLSFSLSSVAPASVGSRAIVLTGNGPTVPLNRAISAQALMLDPRGYPVSGADVTFAVQPSTDDTGVLSFVNGAATQTTLDGVASKSATITAAGKVRFRPSFVSGTFSNLMFRPDYGSENFLAASGDEIVVPVYRPAARRPFRVLAAEAGRVVLSDHPLTRLEPERIVPRRREEGEPTAISSRSPLTKPATSADAGSPTPKIEPRPLPRPMSYARVPLAITGCSADLGLFVAAGVTASEVYPPFTVTLTDLTSPIGGGPGNRTIDGSGIRDHRVEKEVRIKIDVKDGHGATPNHPVLVELALDGPRHGQLILDPNGARVTCDTASFLWHESGNSNEQFGYKLGTLALFAGLMKDSVGAYQPIWDEAEVLAMQISTVDAAGIDTPWENDFAVLPQPGKPDHFACYEADGSQCPTTFRFWSPYRSFDSGGHQASPPVTIYSSYELADRFDNETYGFSNTSMTAPASNVTAQFFDQVPGTPFYIYGIEYGRYGFSSQWTNVPAWPSGNLPSTLRVDYPSDPDGDWTAGSVTKDITYQFDTGTSHALIQSTTYDLARPDGTKGVTDGTFPMSVRPAMVAANMPKTEAGDTRRLTLLTVSGDQTWADWWQTISNITYTYYAEPYSAGTRFWRTSDGGSTFSFGATKTDPKLETTDNPAFRFTLIDADWKTVTDGSSFRVYRCPRFDHESQGRSCSTVPVDSVNGVVDNFYVNSGDARGYVGVELTRAPLATGLYFVKVESLGQNYRVRRQGQLVVANDPNAGEWAGAFQLAIVDDPVADCACETCNEQCTASPNFIGTGTYQARAADLSLPTAGFPLQVSRRYLSSNKKTGLVGLGWTTSLESRIWFSTYIAASGLAAPAANVLLPGGEQFRFTINGLTGAFDPPNGRRDTLVRNPADLSFDFTVQRSRTVYHFDKNGRLTTMNDEFGNAVTITYNASGQPLHMADQAGSGRYLDVSWRGDGKIDYVQDSAGRRVSYGYAADGTLTSVTDPANRITHYGYTNGSYGPLLTQISDNWNRVLTVVTYDAGDRTKSYSENLETYTYTYVDGATTTKTNSSGQTSTFTTVPNGQITNRTPPTAPGSGTAHTDYNPDGSVAGTTDEVGVRTTYGYDANGRVAAVTRDATGAAPVRFDYTYDPSFPDKVVSVTPKNPGTGSFDSNWQGWRYDYFSGSGTLNHVYRLRNDGVSTDTISNFLYDTKGRITQQTSASGAVTNYVYVGADLNTVTHPSNNDSGARPVTTYTNYDGVGRPRTITDPAGKDTTYTYDALGRVLTVTLPKPTPSFSGNFTTTYSYDNFDSGTGLVFTHITDPNGRLTKLGYDEHGRLLKSIDAANNTTTYGYTRDVLTSITDANDNVTTYHYDPLKRLDKTTFPDGKFETYTYWADGLLNTKTDRMGQTLTYEYDAFKRLKKKTYPNTAQTITYTYQGQKLTQVDDLYASPAETHNFVYDPSYRVQQNVQSTRGTLTYTYTPDDRVDTLTIAGTPNVTTTHTYYADGSLNTMVWSPQAGQFKYAYTPRGQYQTVTLPNGQTRTYDYDDQGRLTNLANALGATNIATYAYGYDVDWATGLNTMLGQRVSMTANVPSQGFTNALTKYSYDPLYQLQKAEYPNVAPFNAEVHQWTYDAIGNRLTSQVNAAIQTYTYEKIGANPKNAQKLMTDGVNAYAYDFNGSQTSRTGFGFVNDPDNRLAAISGNETATYTYDYQGRRTSKTVGGVTTKYLYDGLNLVSETAGGATTRYAFGPSIDEPLAVYASGAVSYLNADGLGSVVATNSAAGGVSHSSIFDAWGVAKSETGTRTHSFTYTGREVGEAGLHFYRARLLDPARGRFIAEDPIRFNAGPHFFAYANGNPALLTDPYGLAAVGDLVFFNWSNARSTFPQHVALVTAVDKDGTPTQAFGGWGDTMTFHAVDLLTYRGGVQDNIIGTGRMEGLTESNIQDFMKDWTGKNVAEDWDGQKGLVCIDVATAGTGFGGEALRAAMKADFKKHARFYANFGGGKPDPNNSMFYRRNAWLRQFFINTGRYDRYR